MVDKRIINKKIYVGRDMDECIQRIKELGGIELEAPRQSHPFLIVNENGEYRSTNDNINFISSVSKEIKVDDLLKFYPHSIEWEGDEEEEVFGRTENKEYKIKFLNDNAYTIYNRDLSKWGFSGHSFSLEDAKNKVAETIYKSKEK